MNYYMHIDLKTNRIFLTSYFTKDKRPFFIECFDRGEADRILSRLNSGILKDPYVDKNSYKFIETFTCKLGELDIYRLNRNA